MAWRKIADKNYQNHLRSNNYEAYTAVAFCFPNILDAMVFENINLSSDKIMRLLFWCSEVVLDFCHQSLTLSAVYISTTH
jgi:hypothetical protein